jgi:hypothetical protein
MVGFLLALLVKLPAGSCLIHVGREGRADSEAIEAELFVAVLGGKPHHDQAHRFPYGAWRT